MKARILGVALVVLVACGLVIGLGRSQGSKKKVAEPVRPAKSVQPARLAQPAMQPAPKPQPAAQPAQGRPTATPPSPAPPDPDKVLATVNGAKITSGQVEPVLDQFVKRQLASLGPIGAALPPDTLAKLKDRARPNVVQMFVEQQLVEEQVKAKGITVTDEDLDGYIATLLKDNDITLEDVEKDLERSGQTMAEFRKQVRTNLGLERLLKSEMKGKVPPVDEAAAKKFYDENPDQFTTPEQVRASHILIKTEGLDEAGKKEARSRIEDILAKVKAGEDFAELAKAHSNCPSASQGGDLGFFDRKRMVPEFSEAAFKLKVGQVSDIVETKFGYHIIKVTDHKDAETKTFEDVKGDLIKNLTRQQQYAFWNTYRQQLKANAKIEYADEIKQAMQAATPKTQPVTPTPAPQGN